MTGLPVVVRELRVAARRPATYWARLASGAATISALVFLFPSLSLSPRLMGVELFQMIFAVNFIVCLLSGTQLTSDCICRERREGTLGFLFLTDLKPLDVILGKLAVTSVRAFYNLLAIVPMLSLPLVLGGLTLGDVALGAMVLVNTMFFSLTAGLLISIFNQESRKAAGWALALIMCITAGLPALGGVIAYHYELMPLTDVSVFFILSPGMAAVRMFDRTGFIPTGIFWLASSATFLWSVLFLILANNAIRRAWQDRPASVRRARWRDRWHDWMQGNRAARIELRRRLLNINPMLWLASRNRLKRYYVWVMLLVAVITWFWGLSKLAGAWLEIHIAAVFAIGWHSLLKLVTAADAGERFGLDLRSGALELVLSTRTSVEELLQGQWLALRRNYLQPAIVILILDALLLIGALTVPGWQRRDLNGFEIAAAMLGAMIVFVLDLRTLGWVGMWMGIASRDLRRAAGDTIGRVLMLPWLAVFVVNSGVSLLNWFFRIRFEIPFLVQLAIWFTFSVFVDYKMTEWAAGKLRANFRIAAMSRYLPEAPNPMWAALGRLYGRLRAAVFK